MCANLLSLERDIRVLVDGGADMLHVDMMDGHFVKNYGLCYDLVRQVKGMTDVPLDLHLAMNGPEDHIGLCRDAGADYVTFHPETTDDPRGVAKAIRASGMRACIAVSPSLPLSALEGLFDHADMVNVLTVNPGFAGQKLIPSALEKLGEIARTVAREKRPIPVEVDGNVSYENIPRMIDRGATVLVLGTSSLFKRDIPLDRSLKDVLGFIHGLSPHTTPGEEG